MRAVLSILLAPFLCAFLIVFTIKSFIVDIHKVPSSSMEPNLLVGDFVVLLKYKYGYGNHFLMLPQIPLLDLKDRFWEFSEPKRGDIVVFRRDFSSTGDYTLYVKRVIGISGDVVQLLNGIVHINGRAMSSICNEDEGVHYKDFKIKSCREVLSDVSLSNNGISENKKSVLYKIKSDHTYSDFPNSTQKYVIPKGYYFMLGDNRLRSADSRYMGLIRKVDILGKVKMAFNIRLMNVRVF